MINKTQNKLTQYFIPKTFYNNIYLDGRIFTNESTSNENNLKFYDNKLLKEMDNLTLRQLADGIREEG